ncbi:RNA polymerase sigma-70 factor (sigma-E family) [Nocardioides cavernae]|uniref:RNA polymerase sigma-70 factor (Sigma-E family) n=1 Tax=Nocardioides cavernae TaxID=1921566 RepID=A0A7Y9H3F3_9ACTN|nr:SigE family RNA polymerase sigma factor [Nocardioides cavernae]NYE37247.1 RNA polymerase sigma-70 factor (sigma-E family) [Nocardioides cavernae]
MRDEAAFVEFAETARPRLRRTAYLLCGDWDRASDFVQEGLIRVYVRWPRLVRNGGELAYARKAVVSAYLDHARRRSSTERPGEADPTLASPVDVAHAVATRETLMATLADLPPRQRACVVLRYFEDLSVEQTAALLGCTEGTVKSQTSRGLFSLRSMLEEPADESSADRRSEGAVSW